MPSRLMPLQSNYHEASVPSKRVQLRAKDRHFVPTRQSLPLHSNYQEVVRKNSYKRENRFRHIIPNTSTLETSPQSGNAGKPRRKRKWQPKVARTKSSQNMNTGRTANSKESKEHNAQKANNQQVDKPKRKQRRSEIARLIRTCNRAQKRAEARRLYRMVRKCCTVQAPQSSTYHGAQEGTTDRHTDQTDHGKHTKTGSLIMTGTV